MPVLLPPKPTTLPPEVEVVLTHDSTLKVSGACTAWGVTAKDPSWPEKVVAVDPSMGPAAPRAALSTLRSSNATWSRPAVPPFSSSG